MTGRAIHHVDHLGFEPHRTKPVMVHVVSHTLTPTRSEERRGSDPPHPLASHMFIIITRTLARQLDFCTHKSNSLRIPHTLTLEALLAATAHVAQAAAVAA